MSPKAEKYGIVLLAIVLPACGPNSPATETDGNATGGDASTGDSVLTTTGSGATNCLTPQTDGVPTADAALMCIDAEDHSGKLALTYLDWPTVVLDECGAGKTEIDTVCTVDAINTNGTASEITLACEDGDTVHPLSVELGAPQLHFPVCTGDQLRFLYRVEFYGCPIGGGTKSWVLRASAGDRLLAAAFDHVPPAWIAPLELTWVDVGCEWIGDTCFSSQRAALAVDDGVVPAVIVHDNTRRVAELGSRFVIQASGIEFFEQGDGCGEGGAWPEIELVLADP